MHSDVTGPAWLSLFVVFVSSCKAILKKQMLVERSGNQEATPLVQPGSSEGATRSEVRMFAEESAGRFHRVEVAVGHLPAGV